MKKTMKWGVIRIQDVQYGATKTQKIPMVDPKTITDSKNEAVNLILGDGKVTRVLHVC